jgi:hypothetical protein
MQETLRDLALGFAALSVLSAAVCGRAASALQRDFARRAKADRLQVRVHSRGALGAVLGLSSSAFVTGRGGSVGDLAFERASRRPVLPVRVREASVRLVGTSVADVVACRIRLSQVDVCLDGVQLLLDGHPAVASAGPTTLEFLLNARDVALLVSRRLPGLSEVRAAMGGDTLLLVGNSAWPPGRFTATAGLGAVGGSEVALVGARVWINGTELDSAAVATLAAGVASALRFAPLSEWAGGLRLESATIGEGAIRLILRDRVRRSGDPGVPVGEEQARKQER